MDTILGKSATLLCKNETGDASVTAITENFKNITNADLIHQVAKHAESWDPDDRSDLTLCESNINQEARL